MTWFFLFTICYLTITHSSTYNNIKSRFSNIELHPVRKYLEKSNFGGKFTETFRDKTPNEYQKQTRQRSENLKNEMHKQMKASRFKIGNPTQIANDLSWIQVDNKGNQIEFDIPRNDIESIMSNMESKRHSIVLNFNNIRNNNNNNVNNNNDIHNRRRTYVMGQDNRFRVDDMSRTPPIHVGLIRFRSKNEGNSHSFHYGFGSMFSFGGWGGRAQRETWQQCTGTLIGPRHVLTAGHCVHEGKNGDWYKDFRFYLGGIDNDDEENYYGWHDIKSINCWIYDSDFDCDFGLLILDREPNIGYMKIGYNEELTDDMWFAAFGYPTKTQNQLWLTGCYLWEISENNLRDTECDIEPGQSGSALSTWIENERIIFGIVSNENYIQTSNGWYSNKKYFNQHTRINRFVYTTICYWIQNDGYYGIC